MKASAILLCICVLATSGLFAEAESLLWRSRHFRCRPKSLKCSDRENFISDHGKFSWDLYTKAREIAANGESENIFLSPASISLALGMLNLGAGGNTMAEITEAMMPSVRERKVHCVHSWMDGELDSEGKDYELHTANGIFVEQTLSVYQSYLDHLESCFRSEIETMDFLNEADEATQEINEWVEDNTNGKITDLIPEGTLNSNTKLVLANAIYFKGEWQTPFTNENRAHTSSGYFYPQLYVDENSPKQNVEMMSMTSPFLFTDTDDVKVLGMPYKNNDLTMFLFLPKAGSTLAQFEENSSSQTLTELMEQTVNRTVAVRIPKFNISADFELKRALQELEIREVFTSGSNLTAISSSENLMVDSAVHKAFVEVNEKGTEAAAATAIFITRTSLRLGPRFTADHPFLFLIRHESTQAILFIGSVNSFET